jgi:hypothetical protein
MGVGELLKLTISRRITRVGNMDLSIKILIPEDKGIVTRNVYDNGTYIDFSLPAFLSLELLLPFDGFSRRRGGMITLTEIGKIEFIGLAKKVLKIMQREDVFYEDDEKGLSVYSNIGLNGISNFQVTGKVGKEIIAFHPDVFEEEDNNIKTEGVRITIARSNVSIVVTYSDLLIILEIIKSVNISELSQMLYMTFRKEIEEEEMRKRESPENIATRSRLDDLLARSATRLEAKTNGRIDQKND